MSNVIRIWLIVLGIMGGGPALGAEATRPTSDVNLDVARSAFQRGVEFFHEGNFQAALAEFQKANFNGPSYRILYNIAQAQYELHDYVAALKSYKQYLANGAAEIPAVRRTQVEETIAKLQTRIAYLEISISVEGAQISIDDVPIGISPLTGPVPVNPGPRRVTAAKAGLLPATRSVTVAGADHIEIGLELRAAPRGLPSAESAPPSTSASPVKTKTAHSRLPLITSLAVTGACAVTTGIFGLLTLQAKNDLDKDLNTFAVSPNRVIHDRSRVRNYALVTDIAAVATLLSGGLSLYLALAHSGDETSQASQPRPRLTVTPTLNGLALYGGF
jgi:tetratricopeptide (TPR) repeat protein